MSGWRARDRRLRRIGGGVPQASGGEQPDTLPADIPVEKWARQIIRDYTRPPDSCEDPEELARWLHALERHIRFRFGIFTAEARGHSTPLAWISDPPRLTEDQSERVVVVVQDFLEGLKVGEADT